MQWAVPRPLRRKPVHCRVPHHTEYQKFLFLLCCLSCNLGFRPLTHHPPLRQGTKHPHLNIPIPHWLPSTEQGPGLDHHSAHGPKGGPLWVCPYPHMPIVDPHLPKVGLHGHVCVTVIMMTGIFHCNVAFSPINYVLTEKPSLLWPSSL